ncbi:hypothetical protein ACJA23_00740 [Mycoplasma corogypsi]|uniref:hypothetical protein n=1 Tax=Mycoplasma corogypsi TaxID=2106 RepID=UPI003873813B
MIGKYSVPTITGIFDYVVEVSGTYNYAQNQNFKLKNNVSASEQLLVISATEDKAYCLVKGDPSRFKVGDELVQVVDQELITTYKEFFGKIIDINGGLIYPQTLAVPNSALMHKSKAFNTPNGLLEYEPLTANN